MKKIVLFVGLVGCGAVAYIQGTTKASVDNKAQASVCSQNACCLLKMGSISSQKIASSYFEVSALTQSLGDQLKSIQKELVAQYTKIVEEQKKVEEFKEQEKNPTLSVDAKKKVQAEIADLEKDLQQKMNAFQDYKVSSEHRLEQAKLDGSTRVSTLIRETIARIAVQKGCELVLDLDNPTVCFAGSRIVDLTDEVLTDLNSKKPKTAETVKPAEAAKQPGTVKK
jgi:Skp family chaperone for outer membrane proteins